MSETVILIGCGNMGYAMLKGWRASEGAPDVWVVEPFEGFRDRAAETGAKPVVAIEDLPDDLAPDLVVVAVKPGLVAGVLGQSGALAKAGATFVSVAAGVSLAAMARALPVPAPVIRCMPNTPAAIGEGMLVLCAGEDVNAPARALTDRLFTTSGSVVWIDDEREIDAVTAISGSGPAYVFHMIEAMAAAGEGLGLTPEVALLLARQTVAGAGRMAMLSDEEPGTLREQVTSPNGVTEAALRVLMGEDRMKRLMADVAEAARARSEEMGREN